MNETLTNSGSFQLGLAAGLIAYCDFDGAYYGPLQGEEFEPLRNAIDEIAKDADADLKYNAYMSRIAHFAYVRGLEIKIIER